MQKTSTNITQKYCQETHYNYVGNSGFGVLYCSPLLCYRFVTTALTAQIPAETLSQSHRLCFIGKERDSETGFSYFGARYYDSDLMTGWLSVDPLADKYPGLSPYAYCAWNPIRLVDPDGMEIAMNDDWYKDAKGYVHWDANVHSQADLKNGESYIGRTACMVAEGDDNIIYGDQYGRTHSSVPLSAITITAERSASNNKKGPAWVDNVSFGVALETSMISWSCDNAYTDYVPLEEANIAKGFNTASKIVQNTGRIAGVAGVIYTGLMASSDGQLSAGEGLRIGLQGLAFATSYIPIYGTAISLGLTAVDFFWGDKIEKINF